MIALGMALLVIGLSTLVARRAARRHEWAMLFVSKARHPYRLLVLVAAEWIAIDLTLPRASSRLIADHCLLISMIVTATWLIGAVVSHGLSATLVRYRTDVPDNRAARRAQTQILIVRRLAVVIIVAVGLASVLLTFPGIQTLGASVLASAGVVSIVAGLAAQSTLGNLFAGIQLAFSGAIRVDDVVVVDTEWGRIEEITLTYVVVHVWDDRRLIVPSTYFTSNPFENWTRTSSKLLGEIDFDLDWRVSTAAMRTQLSEILKATSNWDGRASVLQVTDAIGGYVHVRILVSAADSATLFDLRCFVREAMVDWIQQQHPQTMPHIRIQANDDDGRLHRVPGAVAEPALAGLFTGTPRAEQRAAEFAGPEHARKRPI